jgi:hypothetical protein
VFVTKYGARWVRTREREPGKLAIINSVGLEIAKVLAA